MTHQASVSEIIANASQLSNRDLNALLGQLSLLRAKRTAPSLPQEETNLLNQINEGFPALKWMRLVALDRKMEFDDLTEEEATESLGLAEDLEDYTLQRFENLKKLANLRSVSVEHLMQALGITPQ
jgi:hypothetical protein